MARLAWPICVGTIYKPRALGTIGWLVIYTVPRVDWSVSLTGEDHVGGQVQLVGQAVELGATVVGGRKALLLGYSTE